MGTKEISIMDDVYGKLKAIFLKKNGINKVITRNCSHFERVPGIKVIKY